MNARIAGTLYLVAALMLGVGAETATAGGKSALARAAAARMLSRDTAMSATIAANRAAGAAAERRAAEAFTKTGNKILGSQVSVRTPAGRRVVDHLIQGPRGHIVAIEVKSGRAVRSASQVAKDRAMATKGGILVGKNAPEALRGKHMVIKTGVGHH